MVKRRFGKLFAFSAVVCLMCTIRFLMAFSLPEVSTWTDESSFTAEVVGDQIVISVEYEKEQPYVLIQMDEKEVAREKSTRIEVDLPSSSPAVISVYCGDGARGSFTSVTKFWVTKSSQGWEIFAPSIVIEKNMEQLGTWTDDALGDVIPEIQTLSDQIVAGADTDYEKAKKIYDWVCDNIYYDSDRTTGDRIGQVDVQEVLRDRKGKCGGYQEIFQELCHAQGIPCINVYGYSGNTQDLETLAQNKAAYLVPKYWNHGWNEVYADGRWFIVDCTNGSGLDISNGKKTESFNTNEYFDSSVEFFSLRRLALSREGSECEAPSWVTEGNSQQVQPEFSGISDWAKVDVEKAVGYGFVPEDLLKAGMNPITRREFCELAMRMLEKRLDTTREALIAGRASLSFEDTSDPDVLAASALGIVNGYGNGMFGPYDSITRQEAAAILNRTAAVIGLKPVSADISNFIDCVGVSGWAKEAIAACKSLGVMNGTSGNPFSPYGSYSREQSIVTMVRLFEKH